MAGKQSSRKLEDPRDIPLFGVGSVGEGETPRRDFRWACPSGITTGQLQQAHRLVPLSIGLAPTVATTGQLFRTS